MPLFWKYILKTFYKIFLLSIFSFSFLLLLTRLTTIAKYAALASTFKDVIYFVLIQIPHILPLAIPLSCFIASFAITRNLSITSEITAFRSAGLSLTQIVTPILMASMVLALINFYISAELTPKLRYKSQDFLIEKTSTNPVNLFKKQRLLKINDSFVNFKEGKNNKLKDLIFVTFHPSSKKLLLLSAKELILTKNHLKGSAVTLISSLKTDENRFDPLIIENQLSFSSPSMEIASMMKKNKRKLLHTYSSLKHLKIQATNSISSKVYYSELYRRISLGVYVFIFTFIGISFGLSIQRNASKKSLFIAMLYIGIIITSYLTAKHLKIHPSYALAVYSCPVLFICILCINVVKKISKGAS